MAGFCLRGSFKRHENAAARRATTSALMRTEKHIRSRRKVLDRPTRCSNSSRGNRQKTGVLRRAEDDRQMTDLGPRQEYDLLFDAERMEEQEYTES